MECRWFGITLESFRGPGVLLMIDKLRTVLAKFIVEHLARPRPLVVHAWLWLAAEADVLNRKEKGHPAMGQPSCALIVPGPLFGAPSKTRVLCQPSRAVYCWAMSRPCAI